MITEDYVSFETAKLLKEKGFDEDTNCYYIEGSVDKNLCYSPIRQNHNKRITNNELDIDINISSGKISAPTHQMAMKWLREVHNLHCAVDYDFVLGWYCQITGLKEIVEYDYEEMKHYHPDNDHNFSSAEEACETAIKYCLEKL